ncbi:iron uptake porin [Pantanalinema rosaneae CENA516]|uniref:iron uptake porin n=1 Tax=Pantanalinema rosaneae TaxID=1620701 RepID=UPI003D6F4B10
MSNQVRKLWISGSSSVLLGLSLATTAQAEAIDPMAEVNSVSQLTVEQSVPSLGMEQVTSVSQLTDVRPTDWAFQALQSLVERYGCIVGYPDRTYRGNRAMTRYEFAAGLNACMDKIQELIAAATGDLVRKEDLLTLQRLQEEFAAEVATLRGRVDALDVRTATLEKQQFSTTTRLGGEVVMAVVGAATGDNAAGNRVTRNPFLGTRTRLDFDTSFTGEDLLRTRLQAIGFTDLSNETLTPEGTLRFSSGFLGSESNNVGIDALLYQFPLGERTTVVIEANAGAVDDFVDTINPFFDGDGGSGALTNFGTRNSIYYLLDGTGLGVRHAFSDQLEFSAGYLASDAANPSPGAGLFNGPYGAIAQLTFKPTEAIAVGLTYVHAYNNDFTANGATGSNRANLRSFLASELSGIEADVPVSSNAYGLTASWQLNPNIVLNGSVGYTTTRTLASLNGLVPRGDLSIWNWSVGLAFPDLGKRGNLGGLIVGMEPKVTRVQGPLRNAIGEDRDTSLHIEGFYQYQLSDNIAITPGIIWLTAPDHDNRNKDLVIGTVRATFTF